MNPVSHRARRFKQPMPGFSVVRDQDGRLGFTRLHDKGHVIAKAAIPHILEIAAQHRHLPEHHAIYMDKVRKLRRYGTWL